MLPWTRKMIVGGQLNVGGVDDIARYADGRALLMVWPEPSAAYPGEALQAFAVAGGQVLLMKIGGYFGTRAGTDNPDYVPPQNGDSNILHFLQVLSRDWIELDDPTRPPYIPRHRSNNLLAFERRR